MKRVLGILTVLICLSSISASAQGGGGGGQQMDPAARAAMMKERYKALGCNDVQVWKQMMFYLLMRYTV